jgi:FMN phosphatase YigB (HAD superfamily)
MKVVLLDLGNTLEYTTQENKDVLMPGALDLLSAIQHLRDSNGEPPVLALVSNWVDPPVEYYNLLQDLGIANFFKPFSKKVTLSNVVGIPKPDERIFRAAIDKIHKNIPYKNVIFITEDSDHIVKARKYGMAAIHFKPPGQTNGDVDSLTKMIPLINQFLSI